MNTVNHCCDTSHREGQPAPRTERPKGRLPMPHSLARKSVLVVEDNAVAREGLMTVAARAGFHAFTRARRTWRAGTLGRYARLRRVMPGRDDGLSGC